MIPVDIVTVLFVVTKSAVQKAFEPTAGSRPSVRCCQSERIDDTVAYDYVYFKEKQRKSRDDVV